MAEEPPSPRRSPLTVGAVVELHTSVATLGAASTTGDIQCPVPVTPQLQLKLPELFQSSDSELEEQTTSQTLDATNTAASSSNAAEGNNGRTTSPPPNCAICLGRCKNKCFTDSCMHQFCFKCLCEWSKVKPECPLCKQTFKSIIHNVKSMDQFEEYHVQPPTVQIPHRPIEVTTYGQSYIVDGLVVNGRNDYEISVANWDGPRAAYRIVRAGRSILYPYSFTGDVAASGASGSGASVGVVHRGELLDMYRQEFPDAVASSGSLSQLWRRYVYDRKLYALPVCDITGRFRDSSARFYRDNPAQFHRLMPWINRDISCLLRNTDYDVTTVLATINDCLAMVSILSPIFRRRMQVYLGTKTAHFIHELNNFARSPYDMIGYDRTVQYSPQTAEEIIIEFSSSASSDDDGADDNVNVVDGTSGGASVERRVRTRQPTAAQPTQPQQQQLPTARNLSEYRVQSRAVAAAAAASNSSSTSAQSQSQQQSQPPPMVNLLSFTISTTSEGTEAPGVTMEISGGRVAQSTAINLTTHNRSTSDVIIDLDDNDLDVGATATVSGENPISSTLSVGGTHSQSHPPPTPTVTENIELTSSSSDECTFVLERKAPHLRTPEMVSLNSESDSDVVFVDEATATGAAANNFSTTDDENDAGTATKRLEAARTRAAVAAHIKNETELYNVGASTSAGLRSTGRKRRQKSLDAEKLNLRRHQRRPRTMCSSNDDEGQQPSASSQPLGLRSHNKHMGSESSFDSEATSSRAAHPHRTSSYSDDSDSDSDEMNNDKDYRRNQRKYFRAKAGRNRSRGNKRTTRVTTKAGSKRSHSKGNERPQLLKRSKLSAAAAKAATAAPVQTTDETDSDDELDERLNLKALKNRLAAQRERAAAERKKETKVKAETKAELASRSNSSDEDLFSTENQSRLQTLEDACTQNYCQDTSGTASKRQSSSFGSTSSNSLPPGQGKLQNTNDVEAEAEDSVDQWNNAAAPTMLNLPGGGTSSISTASSVSSTSAQSSSNSNSSASSSRSSAAEESVDGNSNGNNEMDANSNSNLNNYNLNLTLDEMLNNAAVASSGNDNLVRQPWPEEEDEEEELVSNAAADTSRPSSSSSLAATNEAAAALADFANTDTRLNLTSSFSGGDSAVPSYEMPLYSDAEASHSSDDS